MPIRVIDTIEPGGPGFDVVDADHVGNLKTEVETQIGALTADEIQNDTAGDAKFVSAQTIHAAIDHIAPSHGISAVSHDDTLTGDGNATPLSVVPDSSLPTYSSTAQYSNGDMVRYGSEVWFKSSGTGTGGSEPQVSSGWLRLDNRIAAWHQNDHYTSGQLVSHNSNVWLALQAISPSATVPAEGANWYQLTGRLNAIVSDGTLSGTGVTGDALSVANPTPARVNAAERTAGTETELRSFAPEDVVSMIGTHAPEPADGGLDRVNSDVTLNGLGTDASPLRVANPAVDASAAQTQDQTSTTHLMFSPNQIVAMIHRFTEHEAPVYTTDTGTVYGVGSFVTYRDGDDGDYDLYYLNGTLTETERASNPKAVAKWVLCTNTVKAWEAKIWHKGSVVTHSSAVWLAIGDTAAANEPAEASNVWKRIDNTFTSADRLKLTGIADGAEPNRNLAQSRAHLGQVNAADIATGTDTDPKLISAKIVKDAIDTHGTETAGTSEEIVAGSEADIRYWSPAELNEGIDGLINAARGRTVTQLGNPTISITNPNRWLDTGITVPAGTVGDLDFVFDVGGASATDEIAANYTYRIRVAEFFRLTQQAANAQVPGSDGATVDDADNVYFVVPAGDTSLVGHEVWIARSADNDILISSNSITYFRPMKVSTIRYGINEAGGGGGIAAVETDSSIDGDGTAGDALSINAAEVRNRLGQLDATEIADGTAVLPELISASVLKTAIETHGGGGGGGSPTSFAQLVKTQIGSGNVNITGIQNFQDTGINVTATDGELLFNLDLGNSSDSNDLNGNVLQLRVLTEDWRALTASTAGGGTTGHDNNHYTLIRGTGSTTQEYYIGRSANHNVLVASTHTENDILPLTVSHLQYRAVIGGGGGSSGSGEDVYAEIEKTEIFSIAVNVTNGTSFFVANDVIQRIPDNTEGEIEFVIDEGTSPQSGNSDGDAGSVVALRISMSDWNDAFTVMDGIARDSYDSVTDNRWWVIPSDEGVSYYIGKGTNNRVLFGSSSASADAVPFTAYNIRYSVPAGGGGGSLYQGAWAAATAYTPAQIVQSHASLYVAQKDVPANLEAPHLHTDTEYWSPLVEVQAWPTSGSGDSITLTKFQMVEYQNRVYLFNGNQPETYTDTQSPADSGHGALFHLIGLPPRASDAELTAGTDDNPRTYSPRDIKFAIDEHGGGEHATGFAAPDTTEIFSGNVNVATAGVWATSGHVITQTDGELIFRFNISTSLTSPEGEEYISIKRVLVKDFLALGASTNGSAISGSDVDNAALVVSAVRTTNDREIFIGRTALNEVLISSNDASLNAYPLTIDHLQYRAVAPVGGGVTETEFYNEVVDIATALSYYVAPNSNGWTSYDEIQIEIQIGGGHDEANTTPIKFLTSTLTELDATTSGAAADKPYLGIAMPRFDGDGIRVGASSIGIAKDADNNLMFARLNDFGETNVKIIGITYNAGQGKTPLSAANVAAGTSTEAGPVSPSLLTTGLREERIIVRDDNIILNASQRGKVIFPFGNSEFINDTPAGDGHKWSRYDKLRFTIFFDYDPAVHTTRVASLHESVLETEEMRAYRIAEMTPFFSTDEPEDAHNVQLTYVANDGHFNWAGHNTSGSTYVLGMSMLLNRGWYLGRTFLPRVEGTDNRSRYVDTFLTKVQTGTYCRFGFLFIPREVHNSEGSEHVTSRAENIYGQAVGTGNMPNDVMVNRMEVWGYRHGFQHQTHTVNWRAGLGE